MRFAYRWETVGFCAVAVLVMGLLHSTAPDRPAAVVGCGLVEGGGPT